MLILSGVILLVYVVGAPFLFGVIPSEPKAQERETQTKPEVAVGTRKVTTPVVEEEATPTPMVVGSEVYDLSIYEKSSEEYIQVLDELGKLGFPGKLWSNPKVSRGRLSPRAAAGVYGVSGPGGGN